MTATALVAASLFQLPTRAHPTVINAGAARSSHVLYQDIFIPAGLAPGQTLRCTWANLGDLDPLKRELEPLRIEVKLLTGEGSVIAQAGAAAVGAGRFQSFDFDRDALPPAGEPGTGRLQVQVRVEVSFHATLPLPDAPKLFPASLELVDNVTGQTLRSFALLDRSRAVGF